MSPASRILPRAWLDGELVAAAEATVSALDRTLLYGLGAFETVRLYGGRPFLLPEHLRRLARSLDAVGLAPPPAVARLASGLPALAAANDLRSGLCRITVTAGADPLRGDAAAPGPRVVAFLRGLTRPPAGRPVAVGFAHVAVDPGSPLAGVKSTNYLLHYLLRDAAERAGRVDDLMVDGAGRVTEATVSNVFAVRASGLVTPPVSAGVLPGITRGVVFELAAALGIACREADLSVDDLLGADEVLLTGSGKGVLPVDELDGRPLPARRPVSERLRRAFAERVAAECGVPVEQAFD